MTREEAEQQKLAAQDQQGNVPIVKHGSTSGHGQAGGGGINEADDTSQDRILADAEREAAKPSADGANEQDKPERTITTARSPSADRTGGAAGTTLPVLEEVGEAGSVSGARSVGRYSVRSGKSNSSRADLREGDTRGVTAEPVPPSPMPQRSNLLSSADALPPHAIRSTAPPPLGGHPPPTPPKDPPLLLRDGAPSLPIPAFSDSPITLEPERLA